MWRLGPIFSKKFSKALREVKEEGQWVKESYCIMHCSVASPSPPHSSGSSSVPRAVWGQWQRARWQLELWVSLSLQNVTALFRVHCTPRAQESLWNSILLWTPLHKRRFVPQFSTSCPHCPWDPGELTALFRPKWQQIVFILLLGHLYWFQHKIVLGVGIGKMLIFFVRSQV